jgi:predicted amidohydrolase YtcJ
MALNLVVKTLIRLKFRLVDAISNKAIQRVAMTQANNTTRDTVLLCHRVLTMEPGAAGDATAVWIRAGRIMRVLRREQVKEIANENTVVVDLGRRTLLPGFVDVHAHSEVVCRTAFDTIDCRAPECGSVADVCDALSSGASRARTDWIVGQANLFFDRKLAEGRLPSREELDRVSRDRPTPLRAGGHITVLNSKALEIAGIDRDFVPPPHSVTGLPDVVRDQDGNPSGVVKEMDSLLPLPDISSSELRTALENGYRHYFTRFGVTTIGEISETVAGIECMNDLANEGRLPVSLRIFLWAPGTLEIGRACDWRNNIRVTAPKHSLHIQGVKLFSDGGFSARSAAVNCCYANMGDYSGTIAFKKYFFQRAYKMTQDAGLQIAVHANGDRAQEWICAAVGELGGATSGPTRLRIEHAGNFLPQPRTADAWAEAGIIPVPQPVFLYTFGEYFPDYLGDYGREGRFPFKTLIEGGWRLSGSSDVWIGSEREATNPLFSVWCCLKRQTYTGNFIDTHEALTLEQALKMHTLDAAAALGEDDVRGSIAPGKYADIIALERDPFTVGVDELRTLKVDYVMSMGREVFKRSGAL